MTWDKALRHILSIVTVGAGIIITHWLIDTIRPLLDNGIDPSELTVISLLLHPITAIVSFIAGGYLVGNKKD